MGEHKFYLENNKGETIRSLNFTSKNGFAVQRKDSKRICFISELTEFEERGIDFVEIQKINLDSIKESGLEIPGIGKLKRPKKEANLHANVQERERDNKSLWLSSVLMLLLFFGFAARIVFLPEEVVEKEEEKKKHIVKIFKPVTKRPQVVQAGSNISMNKTQAKTKPKKRSIKRMGALAVLGSSKRSKNRGGVNLGQVKTSRGPGLGGTQGSGGIQKSLYGKGIIGAPVGPGANIKGAGGYGTKGKGGGQAGYGSLSLVGSSGTSSIPLGQEALVQGGLDRDLIAAVIQRNMGQVRFCYEQGLQLDPKISGRVAIGFVIGPNGVVSSAKVASTSLNSRIVENCIVMRLKTWKFPKPQGGVSVSVKYPFLLKRAGQG